MQGAAAVPLGVEGLCRIIGSTLLAVRASFADRAGTVYMRELEEVSVFNWAISARRHYCGGN
jgi:hypothetical protein